MGIEVEFNPDLALRNAGTEGRKEEECVPKNIINGNRYKFLKRGQRNYWLKGEVPLRITEGDQRLSRPLASVLIIYVIHKKINGEIYTEGEYEIKEVFNLIDTKVHFDGMERIK